MNEINSHLYGLQKEYNFSFRWCDSYHLQIKGHYLISVWPTKRSFYMQGANKKAFYNSIEDVVKMACAKSNLIGVTKKSARKCLKARKLKLWEKGSRNCYVCGKKIKDKAQASIEHIIPLSRGGSNRRDNTALSHIVCNMKRKNSMLDDAGKR